MVKFRKNPRLKNYNYKNNGGYFVTICTDFRKNIIQEKERLILEEELKKLQNRFNGAKIDYYVIMGNHIHIIFIFNAAAARLQRVVQTFKSVSTLRLKKEGFKGKIFWQRNYYEHVIRNNKALEKIRLYIMNNPWVEKLKMEEIYNSRASPPEADLPLARLDHYKVVVGPTTLIINIVVAEPCQRQVCLRHDLLCITLK